MHSVYQNKVRSIIESKNTKEDKLLEICGILKDGIAHYDWVGFYFKNGDKKELKLAQYVGKPTDHTIIPFGKGICWQVAENNETFVVQDIHEQDNYIACSIDVKSEIVVPIFKNGKNIGQIDIDSNTPSPFTQDDEDLLEFVCEKVSGIL